MNGKMIQKLTLLSCLAGAMLSPSLGYAQTSAEIWAAYQASPNAHANIPNVSFAGYARGERSIPNPTATINVKDQGAKGDGITDDTLAFEQALTLAKANCGVIEVPAGTYILSRPLFFDQSGVVLRGAGSGATILDFATPLTATLGALSLDTSSQWSWAGGLIWVGPKDTRDANGKVVEAGFPAVQGWEYWRPGVEIGSISAQVRGDNTITLTSPGQIEPGELVLLTWENPADNSFLKHVYGHTGTADAFDWAGATWITNAAYPRFQWPVLVTAVNGAQLTLAQPLRLDIRPEWGVKVSKIGSHVREVGIEHLTIKLHAPATHTHLTNVGWNGLYFNRAYNSWARDLVVENAENPVIVSSSKNVSILGVSVTGSSQNHHSFACRVSSHDILFDGFVVDGPARVKHGINVEWFSSGNVWTRGTQKMGTFDTHRALAFDNVRTELSVRDLMDAAPGGAGQAGPFIGARMVHWNVDNQNTNPPKADPGQFIRHPAQYVMGAMVGVSGPEAVNAPVSLPPGDKGTLVASDLGTPVPTNLFAAEVQLRLGASAPSAPSPVCQSEREPGTALVGAGGGNGTGGSGATGGATSAGATGGATGGISQPSGGSGGSPLTSQFGGSASAVASLGGGANSGLPPASGNAPKPMDSSAGERSGCGCRSAHPRTTTKTPLLPLFLALALISVRRRVRPTCS
ncbi:MAG: glycosyl hydrolase family 28-related protein [Polyangiaceae bacterium]|nr:glycosyl hydrolase family 28-related protein [Polyangiaceae bacterium]